MYGKHHTFTPSVSPHGSIIIWRAHLCTCLYRPFVQPICILLNRKGCTIMLLCLLTPSPATSQLPTPESCHKTILSMDLPFNFYASETCVYVFFFGWSDFTVTLHIETPVLILLTHTEHSPRDEVLPRSNTPPTFALLAFGRLGI
jgi:hypothetical protein